MADHANRPWNILLPLAFALGSAPIALAVIIDFRSVGSHATIYTDAARAWLEGGNPWLVGPPAAVFAGPPTMLVPFAPFVGLPADATRFVWVVGTALLAIWTLRRLGLPGYWLGFPPILQSIHLGHPEVLMLWLLVAGGPVSGLAATIKPYAGLALLAERRWMAIGVSILFALVTAPLLPWAQFVDEIPNIASTLRGQSHGDSTFGEPLLMGVAVVALASLGLRRAMWLAAPLFWPSAQPIYRVMTVPQLSPMIAMIWAIPIPGATLAGVVAEAALRQLGRRRNLPIWLQVGLIPAASSPAPAPRSSEST